MKSIFVYLFGVAIGACIFLFIIKPVLENGNDKKHLDGKFAVVEGQKYLIKCSVGQNYKLYLIKDKPKL